MRTIKRQTIRTNDGYMVIFYWAAWSQQVCIVKEHQATSLIGWKIMNDLPSARKLWAKYAGGYPTVMIGPKEAVDSISEWHSERIKWVREMFARDA